LFAAVAHFSCYFQYVQQVSRERKLTVGRNIALTMYNFSHNEDVTSVKISANVANWIPNKIYQ